MVDGNEKRIPERAPPPLGIATTKGPPYTLHMKACRICTQPFTVEEEDRQFYEKLKVPEPIDCPPCRDRARLAFRNERYYYPRSCDLCKKNIISVYDPSHTQNVYCHACFWSDQWDPRTYGRPFDEKKPFFEQYHELMQKTPKLAMMSDNGTGSENCEYTYDIAYGKNSYLVIGSWYFQDCLYGFQTNYDKDCIDNYFVNESELMYNSLFCERCYNCQDCMQCEGSNDCIFGFDLKGCRDCLFSAGLRHKQYYIGNQPYSKEEYFKKKAALQLDSWEKREQHRQKFEEFLKKIPRRYANLPSCEDCTGDNIAHSKNAKECYAHRNLHNCKWMTNGYGAKDCYECYSTSTPELCYNCITPDNSYNVIFSVFCWKSQFVSYSDNCHSSHDLFGCVGMKRNEYSILNKEYTKEEYGKLVPRIIEHMKGEKQWGTFFSPSVTPFAYNESAAYEWYPLDETEAKKLGYRWQPNLPGSFGKETISWEKIPDSINDIQETSTLGKGKEIFHCIACGRNFKILQKEFQFYKKGAIPLPRHCVDCRYYARKKRANPRQLWERSCQKCSAKVMTTYAPNRPEIITCQKCYETMQS